MNFLFRMLPKIRKEKKPFIFRVAKKQDLTIKSQNGENRLLTTSLFIRIMKDMEILFRTMPEIRKEKETLYPVRKITERKAGRKSTKKGSPLLPIIGISNGVYFPDSQEARFDLKTGVLVKEETI